MLCEDLLLCFRKGAVSSSNSSRRGWLVVPGTTNLSRLCISRTLVSEIEDVTKNRRINYGSIVCKNVFEAQVSVIRR